MMLATDWEYFNLKKDLIKGACTISGLYNLNPILLSDINMVLAMNKEIAFCNSPIRQVPPNSCPLVIAVGSDETDEFLDQSRELYDAWKDAVPAELVEIQGLNHYSIVETILNPQSCLHQAMRLLIKI